MSDAEPAPEVCPLHCGRVISRLALVGQDPWALIRGSLLEALIPEFESEHLDCAGLFKCADRHLEKLGLTLGQHLELEDIRQKAKAAAASNMSVKDHILSIFGLG